MPVKTQTAWHAHMTSQIKILEAKFAFSAWTVWLGILLLFHVKIVETAKSSSENHAMHLLDAWAIAQAQTPISVAQGGLFQLQAHVFARQGIHWVELNALYQLNVGMDIYKHLRLVMMEGWEGVWVIALEWVRIMFVLVVAL